MMISIFAAALLFSQAAWVQYLMEPLLYTSTHTHIFYSIENDNDADCDVGDEPVDDGEEGDNDDDQSHFYEKSPNLKLTNVKYFQDYKCF